MYILGISAFYHDSAACLVHDGRIVAAAQEERFTRKKHDAAFPAHAVRYCLEEAGITAADLGAVAFYDKPLKKFDRILETYLATAPRGLKLFLLGLPVWLKQKLYLTGELDRGLEHRYRGRYVYLDHHESHGASAFFPSPFEEAAVLTLDGVGEWATGSIGVGNGNRLQLLKELHFPHSLGLLYSAFTYFTGFKVNSGEYKLMGLAPYGEPVYADVIREKLLDLKDDGSFRMNMEYFGYTDSDVMTSPKLNALFGGPPRTPESPLTQREMDLAASIQVVTEEIMLRIARYAHALTGKRHLCLAGGVALNCVGNGRVLRDGPFDDLWIQPAAGDAGGALGAALFVWHELFDAPRTPSAPDAQSGSLLGPRFDDAAIRAVLDAEGAKYESYETEEAVAARVADLLAAQHVVGHFAGRMEFGPRALGARSILGDARSADMQSVMNLKIKFRESFRPFAPAVLGEHVHEYFQMREGQESPYMLLVAPIQLNLRLRGDAEADGDARGLNKLKQVRSVLPAVTHVDFSARVQTVDRARNPRFHAILKAFYERTGTPVVVNTSFNVRGEPIVCTPKDAWNCFANTDMDALVLERFVVLKSTQPELFRNDNTKYLDRFALD